MSDGIKQTPYVQGATDAATGRPKVIDSLWGKSQRADYNKGYDQEIERINGYAGVVPAPRQQTAAQETMYPHNEELPQVKEIKDRIKHGINRCYAGGQLDGSDPWATYGFELASQLRGHQETIPPSPKTAADFLSRSRRIMQERGQEYDEEGGERSMGKTVEAFNIITGRALTEAEGWLLLQILKDVRQWTKPAYHADSAIDGVAYSALKAEALAK